MSASIKLSSQNGRRHRAAGETFSIGKPRDRRLRMHGIVIATVRLCHGPLGPDSYSSRVKYSRYSD